jgi:hypothetical protein
MNAEPSIQYASKIDELFVVPARSRGEESVAIRVQDLTRIPGLEGSSAELGNLLKSGVFQAHANVSLIEIQGPEARLNSVYIFRLN